MIPKRNKENLQVCYMDIDGLVIDIKSLDVYKDIAINVEEKHDKSHYETRIDHPLEVGKKPRKVIRITKDEKDGEIAKIFATITTKNYVLKINEDQYEIQTVNSKREKELKSLHLKS